MWHKLIATGLLASGLIIVSACENHPDPQGIATDKSSPDQIYYVDDNVSFYYPPLIADHISAETIDASKEGAFIAYPASILISLEDYIITETLLSPGMQVFPLEEYYLLSDDAAATIDRLKAITAGKEIADDLIELPYLPEPLAVQKFFSNPKLIESSTGAGLRFLTQYGQDLGPVTNQGLFYTYQGLTADQEYYISAVFPVNHPELPLDWDDFFASDGTDYAVFEENYTDYLELTVMMLDQAGADDFRPSLQLLDNMIESLQIEK